SRVPAVHSSKRSRISASPSSPSGRSHTGDQITRVAPHEDYPHDSPRRGAHTFAVTPRRPPQLPKPRYESITNTPLVARVARQLFAENAFLSRYPPHEQRNAEEARQYRKPRSQRDATRQRDSDRSGVPGVP